MPGLLVQPPRLFHAENALNEEQTNTVYNVDEASLLSDVYSESEFFRSGTGYLLLIASGRGAQIPRSCNGDCGCPPRRGRIRCWNHRQSTRCPRFRRSGWSLCHRQSHHPHRANCRHRVWRPQDRESRRTCPFLRRWKRQGLWTPRLPHSREGSAASRIRQPKRPLRREGTAAPCTSPQGASALILREDRAVPVSIPDILRYMASLRRGAVRLKDLS